MVMMWWKASKPCMKERQKYFLPWVVIFFLLHPIPFIQLKHCENVDYSACIYQTNRSHLVHGEEALILPCLGRSDKDMLNGEEQFVSCENSMGVVQSSKGVLKPVSDKLLSEPVIVCRLAKATLGRTEQSKLG